MKNKAIFKVNDKVYCIMNGHGIIDEISEEVAELYPIKVKFNNVIISYTYDGRYSQRLFPTLSFTEYKLEGFTQERPEILPNEGDIVWIKEDEDQYYWQIGHFYKKIDNRYLISSGRPGGWSLSGVVMTTENPYINEHRNKN